jgi:very-short-patch-repair endonuclease
LQRALHIVWGFDSLEPQVEIRVGEMTYRADFADRERKILVECEGATHRTSAAQTWDARRFTALTLDGWFVLRFTWAHVVYDPAYVLASLSADYAARP